LLLLTATLHAQSLKTNQPLLDSAFQLAVWTIDHNTHQGLIEAGGGYGGEWTRDCAINCWNAVSLLRPAVAEKSLWSVTNKGQTIGHQYWDKIIWTIAALNHYYCTLDERFLKKSYACAARTMSQLEDSCFDVDYGLFKGPAVFQDGIAGYDEPVYDPKLWDDSYVLHHKNSMEIKCLSTNAVYVQAYRCLAEMAALLQQESMQVSYLEKADALKTALQNNFYDADGHRYYYLIDHLGKKHEYQEGLGLAFVLLFDLLDDAESANLVKNVFVTSNGIPCVSPSFPRNTDEKPGRHNMMIWPHVNMLYASGCHHKGLQQPFFFEMENLAKLAIRNGRGDFYEIYTIDGKPSGGYQCGALWDKKEHQTWCATGYLRLFLQDVFGLTPAKDGLHLKSTGMKDGSECVLSGVQYQDMNLTVTLKGHGNKIKKCSVNGKKSAPFLPATLKGDVDVQIWLK